MMMGIAFASLLLSPTLPTAQADMAGLQSRLEAVEAKLNEIDSGIQWLLINRETVDRSCSQRAAEAQSLVRRFSGLPVADHYTTLQFLNALSGERQTTLRSQIVVLREIETALRRDACDAIRSMRAADREIRDGEVWTHLSQEARLALNELTKYAEDAAAVDDPCRASAEISEVDAAQAADIAATGAMTGTDIEFNPGWNLTPIPDTPDCMPSD
jgi:hypothetical protein